MDNGNTDLHSNGSLAIFVVFVWEKLSYSRFGLAVADMRGDVFIVALEKGF